MILVRSRRMCSRFLGGGFELCGVQIQVRCVAYVPLGTVICLVPGASARDVRTQPIFPHQLELQAVSAVC